MTTKAQSARSLQLAKDYANSIHNVAIPTAMSALWKKEPYPQKSGFDRLSSEPLLLWGLNLERRREGHGSTYYTTLTDFKNSMGRFYHEYLHELHFMRFIDIRGRLWTPIAESNTHYTSAHAGNLLQFDPFTCTSWSDLSNWKSVLMAR